MKGTGNGTSGGNGSKYVESLQRRLGQLFKSGFGFNSGSGCHFVKSTGRERYYLCVKQEWLNIMETSGV